MSYPKAIVIGAALIAGAIALSTRVQASPVPSGTYQILSGSIAFPSGLSTTQQILTGTDPIFEKSAVWRVNTKTGQMIYCMGGGYLKSSKSAIYFLNCVDSKGLLPVGSY